MGFDSMALTSVVLYLVVRFGIGGMIRKFTTHRGMFHSIPAMFICGGLAYLLCGGSQAAFSVFKAGGVMIGYLSHLVLDEIYSIEFASGRWRMKKSFGTAMKLWGDNHWANTAAYSKLALVGMSILGEPSVMQKVCGIQSATGPTNRPTSQHGSNRCPERLAAEQHRPSPRRDQHLQW